MKAEMAGGTIKKISYLRNDYGLTIHVLFEHNNGSTFTLTQAVPPNVAEAFSKFIDGENEAGTHLAFGKSAGDLAGERIADASTS